MINHRKRKSCEFAENLHGKNSWNHFGLSFFSVLGFWHLEPLCAAAAADRPDGSYLKQGWAQQIPLQPEKATTKYILLPLIYYHSTATINVIILYEKKKKNYERKICISLANNATTTDSALAPNTASKNCYRIYMIYLPLYRYNNSIQNIEDRSEYLPTMLCTFKKTTILLLLRITLFAFTHKYYRNKDIHIGTRKYVVCLLFNTSEKEKKTFTTEFFTKFSKISQSCAFCEKKNLCLRMREFW